MLMRSLTLVKVDAEEDNHLLHVPVGLSFLIYYHNCKLINYKYLY